MVCKYGYEKGLAQVYEELSVRFGLTESERMNKIKNLYKLNVHQPEKG